MKILQVNTVYNTGSTGKIVKNLQIVCRENGIECFAAHRCGSRDDDVWEISSRFDSRLHGVLARFTMFKGAFSYLKTRSFLKKVKKWSPDLIHLHNLHGSYVNIGLLMKYIKKNKIPTVFTLHDCWAFTAICPYFTLVNCDKWKTGCHSCPQRKVYTSSPIDFTEKVWNLKKKWFTGVENLVVVTPSEWLANLTKESFLKEYPIRVIHNGIDRDVFHPTPSDFRLKHAIENKKILLGVAFEWEYRKGLDVIIALSERLPDDFCVVIVGTNDQIDAALPKNIISIHRTASPEELAAIYTAADVLVNPTREENYPTVNMEALSCGTPVVTFKTGGSPEIINKTCGCSVEKEDIDALCKQVLRICNEKPYTVEACLARAEEFHAADRFDEYIKLYEELK